MPDTASRRSPLAQYESPIAAIVTQIEQDCRQPDDMVFRRYLRRRYSPRQQSRSVLQTPPSDGRSACIALRSRDEIGRCNNRHPPGIPAHELLAGLDASTALGIADQVTATSLIDVARASNLMARIQAHFLIRVAKETIAALGVRTRLIADRAGARLAVAGLLGQILTPRQAFAATEEPSRRAAGPERIVRETPGIGRTSSQGFDGGPCTRSARTELAFGTIFIDRNIPSNLRRHSISDWQGNRYSSSRRHSQCPRSREHRHSPARRNRFRWRHIHQSSRSLRPGNLTCKSHQSRIHMR